MAKKIIYAGNSAQGWRVELSIELRDTDKGQELSICSANGQDSQALADAVEAPGSLTNEQGARLWQVWSDWHLNLFKGKGALPADVLAFVESLPAVEGASEISSPERQEVAAFMKAHGINALFTRADSRPGADAWYHTARHWRVAFKLRQPDGSLSKDAVRGWFSQGCAINTDPEAVEVFSCFARDAAVAEGTYGDMLDELGYQNGGEARRLYAAAVRLNERMRALLGADVFAQAIELPSL